MNSAVQKLPANITADELITETDALLVIWQMDLDKSPREAVQSAARVAQQAIDRGAAQALGAAINAPAPPAEVAKAILGLVASFVPPKDFNQRVFTGNMTGDVAKLGASAPALEFAAAQLRRTCDFIPSIKKVLEAVTEADSSLKTRAGLIARLPGRLQEAAKTLAPDILPAPKTPE